MAKMTKETVFKKNQEEIDNKAKEAAKKADSLPKVIDEYEFIKDAFLHWRGKSFKTGDRTKDLSQDDVNKLSQTNHIKKV